MSEQRLQAQIALRLLGGDRPLFSCADPYCRQCAEVDSAAQVPKTEQPAQCWTPRKCWWYESGRCFCPHAGDIPKANCGRVGLLGHNRTPDLLDACKAGGWRAKPGS